MAGTAEDLYAPGTGAPLVAPDNYKPGSDPFLDSMYGVAPPPVDASLAGVQGENAGLLGPGGPQSPPSGPVLGPQLQPDVAAQTQPSDVGAPTPGAGPQPPAALDATGGPLPDLSAPAFPAPLAALPSLQPQAPGPPGVAQSPDVTISMEGKPGAQPLGLPPGVAGPNLPQSELEYQQAIKQYPNPYDIPDPVQRQRALNTLAQTDYGKFTELTMQRDRSEQADLLRKHEEAVNRDIEVQKQNAADFMAAQKDADAKMHVINTEAQKLAETKIGQLSIGQRIGGAIAAFIGGLYQGKTGSARNPGLDAFNDAVNRQIEGEKMDLANKRDLLGLRKSAVAEEYGRHGDMYRAQETVRLAAMQAADRQLAIEQQKYNVNGRVFTDIAQARAGLAAQQMQTQRDLHQKAFENSLKERTTAREELLAGSTIAKNKADIAKTYAETAKLRGELADNPTLTEQQIHERFPQLPAAAIPPGGMKMKELEKHVELYNKATDAGNKENATILRDPVTFDPLPGKDGTPARAGDATIAEKVNERTAQSQRFVDTLSSIKRTLATDPSSWDRSKFAALGTEFNTAKKDFIKSTGANFTSREMQAVEDMFGPELDSITTRATGRSKAIERFNKLIDMAKGDTDSELGTKFGVVRKKNPDGSFQSIIRDTSNPPPPKATPDDAKVKIALSKATDVSPPVSADAPLPSDVINAEKDRVAQERFGAPFSKLREADASAATAIARQNVGLSLQRKQLDEWAAQLRSPDPVVASQAAQHLGDIAGVGQSTGSTEPAIRSYAAQILQNNIGAGIPTEGPP